MKRGQVTYFIIASIIILIAVIMILFARSEFLKAQGKEELKEIPLIPKIAEGCV